MTAATKSLTTLEKYGHHEVICNHEEFCCFEESGHFEGTIA
jgi:hypothetical protein